MPQSFFAQSYAVASASCTSALSHVISEVVTSFGQIASVLSPVLNTARVRAVWEALAGLLRGTDDAQLAEGKAAVTAAYGVDFRPT